MAEQALSSSEKTWLCSCTHSSVHFLFLGSITQQDISAWPVGCPLGLPSSVVPLLGGCTVWAVGGNSVASFLPPEEHEKPWKQKGIPVLHTAATHTWEWGCSHEVSIKDKDTQPSLLSAAGFLGEFMAELSGCSWCSAPLDLEPVGAGRDLPVLDISLWMLWEYAPLKEIH